MTFPLKCKDRWAVKLKYLGRWYSQYGSLQTCIFIYISRSVVKQRMATDGKIGKATFTNHLVNMCCVGHLHRTVLFVGYSSAELDLNEDTSANSYCAR